MTDLFAGLRLPFRTLRQSRSLVLLAVLTLALGIGASTTIYSIVDTILLQPLPFKASDRLVRLVENAPHPVPGRPPLQRGLSYEEFLDWRNRATTFADAAAIIWTGAAIQTDDGSARLAGAFVTTNTFTLLGTPAFLGRTFDAGDDAYPDVVVLTFDAWRRRFQSDAGIVGTAVRFRLPGQPAERMLTVVGVMPARFEFPIGSTIEFFAPLVWSESVRQSSSEVIGHLTPAAAPATAMEEAIAFARSLPPRRADVPPMAVPRFEVQVLKERLVQPLRPALRVLLAAVAAVLLIVCANVTNLMLARGSARRREIAIRFALGARRRQIVRQLLVECVLLTLASGAMGALIAAAGVTLIKELAVLEAPGVFRFAFGTSLLPRVNEISVDVRLFAIVFAITATTSLAVGLLPAFRLSQPASLEALGSRGGGVARSDSRLRAGLVVTQLALATMLLVGAGLLTRSFVNLSAVDRGYEASGVLAFQAVFPPDYATARRAEVIESILARLRALPAIESAGFTRANVLIPEEIFVGTFVPKGRTSQEMLLDPKRPRVRPVSRGYLSTMAATMIDGRELNERDSQASRPAIVISRTVAHTFFGTERAVGQVVDWHVSQNVAVEAEVVGVVEDIRNGAPDGDANAEVFVDYQQLLPLLQRSGVAGPRLDMTAMGVLSFVIRARGEPSAAAPLVREVVRSVDPNTGIDSMVPLDRLVANSVARQRFNMVLLGVFAGVAALLAAIGVYGVLVYAVAQRSREIGIRMALGAARRQVLGLVLRQGSRLTLAGLAFGLLGAAIGARLVDSLLFGITPLDPTTFVAVAVAFALVATLASYVPARRATSVDPMVALRTE